MLIELVHGRVVGAVVAASARFPNGHDVGQVRTRLPAGHWEAQFQEARDEADTPTLIRIEEEWWEGADGDTPTPDLIDDDLRCWRVPAHDFPGTEGAWECWRCTVRQGTAAGTIRWEWRVPGYADVGVLE